MKLYEKIDLSKTENNDYKRYEPEYYEYLWTCISPTFKQIEINRCKKNEDYTTSRATQYFLAYLFECVPELQKLSYEYIEGDSPIEKLFYECFTYICFKEKIKVYLIPQQEITVDNKNYRVDFLIGCEDIDKEKHLKYIVECDGFEYHSTKKQQAYDNQRQRDLENAGYTIIRFSGKEIYDDEVKCVYETLKRLDMEE